MFTRFWKRGAAALLLVGGLLVGGLSNVAWSQDALLAELYGMGCHAFYANQLEQAHTLFNDAIEQGSRDPRCYYFRGLVNERLGRPDEARSDFQEGAKLEATDGGRLVGQSLERIQGSERLNLERYRQQARVEDAANRSSGLVSDTRVVAPSGLPGDAPVEETLPIVPEPLNTQAGDPFGADAGGATELAPPDAAPAAEPMPAQPLENDLFGGGDEPFGSGVQQPAAEQAPPSDDPFGAPAAAPADDPFGADVPAGGAAPAAAPADDPFGAGDLDPGGAAPAPADDPFAAPPAAAGAAAPADDPFGGAGDAPAAPAGDEDDPFAGLGGADPPVAGAPPSRGPQQPSALGSVFRAIGKAIPGGAETAPGAAPAAGTGPAPGAEQLIPAELMPDEAMPAEGAADDPFGDDPF